MSREIVLEIGRCVPERYPVLLQNCMHVEP